jgi:hypothetical protein
MKGRSLIACAAALMCSTEFAMAQQPTPTPAPKARESQPRAEECTAIEAGRIECRKMLEGELGRRRPLTYIRTRTDSALMKRAALGLQIGATGTRRDTIGVFVSAVTPKGPAENAGIIEGDRIVSINGVDLRVASADAEDNYANGLPARRLQREVAKLAPGARVNLRVWSGGRVRDVQVTAGRASDLTRAGTLGFGGDFPGGAYIYRDGFPDRMNIEMMEMPPMPPMAAMPPMPPMAPMPSMPRRIWTQDLPRFEWLDPEHLPRMNIEQGERLRMLAPRGQGPRQLIRI